jgi:Protein of unknown function (DUF3037)
MLIRYLQDLIQGDFGNLGVVLVEEGWPRQGFAAAKLTSDWRELRRRFAELELDYFQAVVADINRDVNSGTLTQEGEVVKGELLRRLEERNSTTLSLSPRYAVETEDPAAEVDRLIERFCTYESQREERAWSVRTRLLKTMETALRARNVWKHPRLIERIPVGEYSKTTNDVRFDLGFTANDNRRFNLYHAVALDDAGRAAQVADAIQTARVGMAQIHGKEAHLTAIVQQKNEGVYATEVLKRAGVVIEEISQFPRIADEMAAEFGM